MATLNRQKTDKGSTIAEVVFLASLCAFTYIRIGMERGNKYSFAHDFRCAAMVLLQAKRIPFKAAGKCSSQHWRQVSALEWKNVMIKVQTVSPSCGFGE